MLALPGGVRRVCTDVEARLRDLVAKMTPSRITPFVFFGVAFAIRLYYSSLNAGFYYYDTTYYLSQADGFLSGSFVLLDVWWNPLFSLVIAAFYALFGASYAVAKMVPLFFGALSVPLLLLLSRSVLGKDSAWSLVPPLLLTIYPIHIDPSARVLSDTLFLCIFLGYLILFLRFLDTDKVRWLIMSGVLAGLCFLCRQNGISIVAAFVLATVYYSYRNRRLARAIVSLVPISLVGLLVVWRSASGLDPTGANQLRSLIGGGAMVETGLSGLLYVARSFMVYAPVVFGLGAIGFWVSIPKIQRELVLWLSMVIGWIAYSPFSLTTDHWRILIPLTTLLMLYSCRASMWISGFATTGNQGVDRTKTSIFLVGLLALTTFYPAIRDETPSDFSRTYGEGIPEALAWIREHTTPDDKVASFVFGNLKYEIGERYVDLPKLGKMDQYVEWFHSNGVRYMVLDLRGAWRHTPLLPVFNEDYPPEEPIRKVYATVNQPQFKIFEIS